ncbi:hypothetical protein KSF_038540 [Reticulibacter mediterranei]|uniref:Uncharacterized protein n=1 Tax=Reticulibacter mediterranei TaxID=2778369 RepID=A0A8J3IFU5_9CHLR|nr:hypothetical protein [Reticulibacter mediterranei]GHO93806.1 hypothetical protein KSF_038540 [Reticulibacter mediterranei]
MDKPSIETGEHSRQQRMRDASAYSARLQEVMRYNRLPSSDYPFAMAILRAISQGDTEEKWKEALQQRRKISLSPSPEKESSSADTDDDYTRLVLRLKSLTLWPW